MSERSNPDQAAALAASYAEQRVLILAALKRARLRAEEVARTTGTQLVQWEDGRVVYVDPPKR
jgi:broad specificity phosphatase PhoE